MGDSSLSFSPQCASLPGENHRSCSLPSPHGLCPCRGCALLLRPPGLRVPAYCTLRLLFAARPPQCSPHSHCSLPLGTQVLCCARCPGHSSQTDSCHDLQVSAPSRSGSLGWVLPSPQLRVRHLCPNPQPRRSQGYCSPLKALSPRGAVPSVWPRGSPAVRRRLGDIYPVSDTTIGSGKMLAIRSFCPHPSHTQLVLILKLLGRFNTCGFHNGKVRWEGDFF